MELISYFQIYFSQVKHKKLLQGRCKIISQTLKPSNSQTHPQFEHHLPHHRHIQPQRRTFRVAHFIVAPNRQRFRGDYC